MYVSKGQYFKVKFYLYEYNVDTLSIDINYILHSSKKSDVFTKIRKDNDAPNILLC